MVTIVNNQIFVIAISSFRCVRYNILMTIMFCDFKQCHITKCGKSSGISNRF